MTRAEFKAAILKEFPYIGDNNARYCAKLSTLGHRTDDDAVLGFVTHYARHNFTDYETRLKKDFTEIGKREARSAVRPALDAVLEYWRTGIGERPTRQ